MDGWIGWIGWIGLVVKLGWCDSLGGGQRALFILLFVCLIVYLIIGPE